MRRYANKVYSYRVCVCVCVEEKITYSNTFATEEEEEKENLEILTWAFCVHFFLLLFTEE